MTHKITKAMVLAAGLGTRMHPLTTDIPKPLVPLNGVTLIDRVLTHLSANGVTRVVVNTHFKADKIDAHLKGRDDIVLSRETDRLETGGGVLNALANFEDEPFYVINSDAVWLDGPSPTLSRIAGLWDDDAMDALLLMQRMTNIIGGSGMGDYFLTPLGEAKRRRGSEVAPYLFAGVQILHPRLFEGCAPGAFSLNVLYDRAQAAGRLYGVVHDGEWYHVGTPEELRAASDDIAHGNVSVNSR
ncbi:MAG: nucleotidyltransferase family protein [Rhodospirillaceae bacterium]|jgi:N-acetyl-alpha-D-muramate 1-phosphate uridylyltransferase|nr:nucleotidyltransferase family protein [Rhodospirillaceae bacterium]